MSWNLVQLADVAPQPWKNGGGTTRELLAWPDAASWRVRLSVAEVAADPLLGEAVSPGGVEKGDALFDSGMQHLDAD